MESTVLANFAEPAAIDGWFVQNDTVMGGVSSSSVALDDGAMVFSGILSTDNNGGFTSVRGPLLLDGPSDGLGAISVMAQGDGRTYLMQVRTTTDSYIQRFTPSNVMSTSLLPLADFIATDWRLAPIANRPPLTSEAVRQVSIYLVDKQEGEFVLRVGSIALVSS
ncbi:MAG: CIA30 family protein [Ilumatobacteraceae bacterium]